jgi:integrase
MSTPRQKLTTKLVEAVPLAVGDEPQRIVLDAQLPGFGLLVGKRTKSFFVQRDLRDGTGRRTVRRSLGKWNSDGRGITVEQARREAQILLGQLAAGIDPVAEERKAALVADTAAAEAPARGITFRDAIALYDKTPAKGRKGKPRAAETVRRYGQMVTSGYLASWMDRPLAEITRKEVRERHEELTKEIAAGNYAGKKSGRRVPERQTGKQTADDVFRWFRAIYNRAALEDEDAPLRPNICGSVNWHRVKAERSAIPSASLADWHKGVLAIPNPVRRDYLLFVLFSGLRRRSAAVMRWEHIDWERRVLRIPEPKGGAERAFDLPLSDYLLNLLRGRQRENPELVAMQIVPADSLAWVWPAYGETGHIAEPREKIEGVPFTIHDLRRTFVTTAEALNLPLHVIGAIVNHRQPGGSVTAGYVAHETDRLREPMQQITDHLLRIVEGTPQ